MKNQNEEDAEKIIKSLLSLILCDYNCKCHIDYDHNNFCIYTYTAKNLMAAIFVSEKLIKNEFINLNDMLQTFLDPTYELWIFDIKMSNMKFV